MDSAPLSDANDADSREAPALTAAQTDTEAEQRTATEQPSTATQPSGTQTPQQQQQSAQPSPHQSVPPATAATPTTVSLTATSTPTRPTSCTPNAPNAPKVIYFVRHAESAYNAFKLNPLNWLTLKALKDPLIFDPPLSEVGVRQLHSLTQTAAKWKLTDRAQLLVVSPLKRAIDTALAVMGRPIPLSQSLPPTDSNSPTYPLPIYVSPLCSEVVDTSADIGSSPAVLSAAYPHFSFSHLSDAWWYHKDSSRPTDIDDEPKERVQHRVSAFLQWLCQRDESCIIVVSHSSFIRHCTGARLKIDNCQVQECTVKQMTDGRIQVRVVREALQ